MNIMCEFYIWGDMYMQLNVEQKKLVQLRPSGHSLIRGVAGSGKTTVAVNRISFLLNHYCFEKQDRILVITFNRTLINYIKYIYEKIQEEDNIDFQSLFQVDSSKVEIYNIDKVVYKYYKKYSKNNRVKYDLADNNVKYTLINESIAQMGKVFKEISILDIKNSQFLLDEIEWIKACNYMELEEYQNVDRIGRTLKKSGESPQKLMKNSEIRRVIFELMTLYNKKLRKSGHIDFGDMALMALEEAKSNVVKKYTHIIVDESQDLTRTQLEFLKNLYLQKEYSSFMFVADTAQSIYTHSWLVKGRSFASIGFDMTGKSNILSKSYRTTTQISQAAYSLIEKDINIVEDDNYVKPSLIDKQGSYPVYGGFASEKEQSIYIIKQINTLCRKYSLRDIVIVAKNRTILNNMKRNLEQNKIPNILVSKNDENFDSDNIKLITMHSIKGLEFKVVIIVGLNEGTIPHISYGGSEEQKIQESIERKLLYVGMTRATEKLYLTSSGKPSRFIEDINPKFLKIKDNCRLSKLYKVDLDKYYFKDVILDLYSNEEKVRQWFLRELQQTYKYPEDLLKVEYKINSFSKIGFADVCVQIYSNDTQVPYILAEVKTSGMPLSDALSQLKSYMSNCSSCQYGLVTNGFQCIVINKDFEEISDVPEFNVNMLPQNTENYKYMDLKHDKKFTITFDSDSFHEIIVKDNDEEEQYTAEDLSSFKIYNSIASGSPIFMNSNYEDLLRLPVHWFNNNEEHFVLKVKGDSMIEANIDNGDLVVIKKQNAADNRDIVAVAIDMENATLKRFRKMGDTVLLIPENEEYEPIQVRSNQVKILGIVVGIMKKCS